MADDRSRVYEVAVPDELVGDPEVAAALEALSDALAADGLLVTEGGDVEGFSFQKGDIHKLGGAKLGKAPNIGKPEPEQLLCLGKWHDDDGTHCTIFW